MLENMKAALFDLDGVIVDTAKYHYLAWKRLAESLGIPFAEEDNEKLKGVNRRQSLEIILAKGGLDLPETEKIRLMEKKNSWYVDYIGKMEEDEILPGAREYIRQLKARDVKIALGSASRNARTILERLNLLSLFDAIVDGTKVENSKPDPEVFLAGSRELRVPESRCVVFEDSLSGVEAARRAGMFVVGIGTGESLPDADMVVSGLQDLIAAP